MRVLAASQALAQGKRRWGNKTPKALLHLAELAIVYPDAQFIHVIRDGRDSASSQARVVDRSPIQNALLGALGCEPGDAPDRASDLTATLRYASKSCFLRPKSRSAGCAPSSERTSTSRLLHFHTTARERIPPSDLSFHPRLGEPPRPLPPSRDGAATGLVQRAAAALIDAELVELGYVPAASSGRRGRIVYVIIGYTLSRLASENLAGLFRHFARSVGARRAARSLIRQSAEQQVQGATLPQQAATPAPTDALERAVTRASVTVVVPTKNAGQNLRARSGSIVRQSVRCGLVVVDCGSVDDSKAIAFRLCGSRAQRGT